MNLPEPACHFCKCHGVPMIPREKGKWRCRVQQRKAQRRFYLRHRDEAVAKVNRYKMLTQGRYGSWMNVLRIERITEITDGT